MRRWHVTLVLALLAAAGVALAGTVPVVGAVGVVAYRAATQAPAPEAVSVVVAPVDAPVPVEPVAPIEPAPIVVTPPIPDLPPPVHEIHTAPKSEPVSGIPELQEPQVAPRPRRPAPVPVELPPDPPGWDHCPACGMG